MRTRKALSTRRYASIKTHKAFLARQLAVTGMAAAAAVAILAGTDAPNPFVYPGFSLHDELELLVEAGLYPREALAAAATAPAQFLRATDSLGAVAEDKLAHLYWETFHRKRSRMSEFNRMTLVAAAEVVSCFNSHSDMEVMEVQWDISCRSSSKSARVADLARIACDADREVLTESGRIRLSRALVEVAISAPKHLHSDIAWKKLIAGLRFDGFEVCVAQAEVDSDDFWRSGQADTTAELVRMLPSDVPDLDLREAESELTLLLNRHRFTVASGHLAQAVSAFGRGEWSSANGELRNLYESYLNEIAAGLGYTGSGDSRTRRNYLGSLQPPFLLTDYNEWNSNNQKPQYVQGLMRPNAPPRRTPGPFGRRRCDIQASDFACDRAPFSSPIRPES